MYRSEVRRVPREKLISRSLLGLNWNSADAYECGANGPRSVAVPVTGRVGFFLVDDGV